MKSQESEKGGLAMSREPMFSRFSIEDPEHTCEGYCGETKPGDQFPTDDNHPIGQPATKREGECRRCQFLRRANLDFLETLSWGEWLEEVDPRIDAGVIATPEAFRNVVRDLGRRIMALVEYPPLRAV